MTRAKISDAVIGHHYLFGAFAGFVVYIATGEEHGTTVDYAGVAVAGYRELIWHDVNCLEVIERGSMLQPFQSAAAE